MTPSWWTDERTAELRERWAKGETGSEIMRAMGARSRNAVVGKIYRLDLASRPRPVVAKRAARTRSMRRRLVYCDGHFFAGEQAVIDEAPPDFKHPKPFIALTDGDCHWPGDGVPGPDLACCAAPVLNGYSYCAGHCRLAYVRPGAVPKAPRQ
jgi:GcrA cell cycle regulator